MNESKMIRWGTPPAFLLFLVFLALKLSGHISWSWWFVTMPLWIGPALFVCFILFILVLILIDMANGKNPFI